ncbi:putative protein YjdJ [bioreactor metagenome]|uniref:Uncharacterized protein n=1 Tax=bioreactor metagenome TaxID=1076179 RepID=A0A645FFN2_9ZZZZ|nr:GNAT family N-acetyltransferase [Sphaerochaeta sp.]
MSMEYYPLEQGFAYGEEGKMPLARITLRKLNESTYAIDHTYVSPQLRGQGIAKQLVLLAAEKARKEGFTIAPLCSYARKAMEEDPSLRDLIKP